MNSVKQCVNSEPMWGYCSRAGEKKKKKERQKTWTWKTRYANGTYIAFLHILSFHGFTVCPLISSKYLHRHRRTNNFWWQMFKYINRKIGSDGWWPINLKDTQQIISYLDILQELRVCLDRTYFVETENLLLKSL